MGSCDSVVALTASPREQIHPIARTPHTLVFAQAISARGLHFKSVAGTGATCVYSHPYLPEQSTASVMSLGKFGSCLGYGLAGWHSFPGITQPTQAPYFQINHRTIFSNAGASRGHLTMMLVGQGITLKRPRNHHLVPTALSRKLTVLLPASWKQKQAPGLSD